MYSKCIDLYSLRIIFDQTTQKSLVSWTAMILGCAQNGHPREALNLLVEARLKENFCRDPTMLIGALTASGGLAAFELCQQLHSVTIEAGFSYYRPVQNSLISAYSKCGPSTMK
jgi:pentatricopeptide repeat protein